MTAIPPPQATGYYGHPPSPHGWPEILYNKRKSKLKNSKIALAQYAIIIILAADGIFSQSEALKLHALICGYSSLVLQKV